MRLPLALLLTLASQGCAWMSRAPGSRGRPSDGWVARAERLPDRGAGWRVLRDDARGGQHWGAPRVVSLVRQVARAAVRAVAGAPDAVPLVVGDLSSRRGGHIPHHASHRAGRDVDLLFFARDALTGAPVVTPEFVRYDRDGNSVAWPVPLRLDAPRTWDVVEAVVRAEGVGVTRVFVATWIERLLVESARTRGRPPWVIERAEQVMHQPGDSAAHDDHLHVRVACAPEERALGCVDSGPLWPWIAKDWEKGDSASADDATLLATLE